MLEDTVGIAVLHGDLIALPSLAACSIKPVPHQFYSYVSGDTPVETNVWW